MECDSSAVIIRSGEVIVAIPTNILIQEKDLYKKCKKSIIYDILTKILNII